MPHKLNYRRLKKKNWQKVQQWIHFTTNITKPSILTFNEFFKLNKLVHSWFIEFSFPVISKKHSTCRLLSVMFVREDNSAVIEHIIPLDFFTAPLIRNSQNHEVIYYYYILLYYHTSYQIRIIYLVKFVKYSLHLQCESFPHRNYKSTVLNSKSLYWPAGIL